MNDSFEKPTIEVHGPSYESLQTDLMDIVHRAKQIANDLDRLNINDKKLIDNLLRIIDYVYAARAKMHKIKRNPT